MSGEWKICPVCRFDILSFRELSKKLYKYKHQLTKKRDEWKDIDTKILEAYESKELNIITLCQTLIEDLLRKPPEIGYSKFIFNLYKDNEISPTENVFLGMLPILRNVVTHSRPPRFDPVYFSILIKALNCSIDIARRRGDIFEVKDIDEYFVEPVCYERILDKIENDGIVLLIGEPTIGKTTITEKVEKLFSEKYRILREYPENPAMVKKNTLIILDNCFGDAKLDPKRLEKTIDLIEECHDVGCKFLLTSRKDVFTDAKNTEYFKKSAFRENIDKACLEIKIDDYRDVYSELVEKLLKRYGASEDKIKEALKRIKEITRELKTPGEIDRFCRQFAVDKSGNIVEIIKKSKIRDEWIKSILKSADLESKYWLTFVLIYNSSPIRKLRIPIYHSGKKDKRQILLELFGKEVLRKTHPGLSLEIIDIFEYISHQLRKLKGIVDIYQVLIEPESEKSELQPSMVKRLTDAYLKFKAPLSDLNDWITGGIFIEFAHETIEESVKNYVLEHEPNLLRDTFEMLKDLTTRFKSKATKLKLESHNEFSNMGEKLYSPDPEDLIIEFYCHYSDILKDFSSFVINILDEKFKNLRSKFLIDLLNNINLISDDSHFGEISHIVLDTPLTDVIDNETYKTLSDLVYDYEGLLIWPNILKDETIKNYIFENLSDPLFNLIITNAIASNVVLIMRENMLAKELLKELLKYATNVVKKTLMIKLFRDFDKISDDLKEIALTELLKYPGYFIGEIFSISKDSAKIEIANRISNLGDKQILRSFITFLILDILIKDYEIFKYSINGLMCFEDVVLDDIVKKYNDKLSNVNKINTKKIYKQISNTLSNLISYSDYLKAFGFPELENLKDISEIYLALKKLIEKYGLDYDVITKCALKNSKILFLLTMSEFIDDSDKKDIILFAILLSGSDKKLIEIFLTLLHFPNEFILDNLFKTYKKNLINYILDLYKRAILQISIIISYFIKSLVDTKCYYYNINYDKILNRDIVEAYEKCRSLYDYDYELPENVILDVSMSIGWKPEDVKAVFDVLSLIEERIAEEIISIPIPAVHSIIEEFIKSITQNETDEDVLKMARLVIDHIQFLKTTCGLEFLGPIIKINLYKFINYIKSIADSIH